MIYSYNSTSLVTYLNKITFCTSYTVGLDTYYKIERKILFSDFMSYFSTLQFIEKTILNIIKLGSNNNYNFIYLG